ncbi:MAG: nitroreductase family protein [Verrucomicrobiota bacterium]
MKTLEAIQTRRSVRKYTDKPIAENMMHSLLAAAMSAPSAGNQQPWHFIVITDKKLMQEVAAVHPHAGMITQAAAAMMICGDETLEKYKGFWPQDCSAATQNILLAAHAQGLGAVWAGIYPDIDRMQAIRNIFKIPKHIAPFSLIPLGYPAENKPGENRFKQDRVHTNRW